MKWPSVALADVCEINVGRTPSRNEPDYWKDGVHPWASISDLGKQRFLHDTKERFSDRALRECNMRSAHPGTVLFSFKLSIGKVGIATREMFTNEAIAALPPKDDNTLYAPYLAYALEAIDFSDVGSHAVMGRTLNKKSLAQIEIPLPPLEEQKRIAAILDQADALRRLRRRALDRLNTLGQANFHEMFGELLFAQATRASRHLSELVRVQSGFAFKSSDFDPVGCPVVRISNLDGAAVHLSHCARVPEAALGKGKNFEVFEGDLLIAMSGATTGKIGLVPRLKERAFLNQRVGKYAIKDRNALTPAFLRYLITTDSYQSLALAGAWGAAQPNVSGSQLTDMYISTPPVAKQHEFERRVARISSTAQATSLACQTAEILFTSLQHRAFRGEL